MTVNLSALAGAGQQFFDNNGNPLSGGKLWSYVAGTTTPQTTYTTVAGNVAHTNPIILDSAGRVATGEIWLTAGQNYKFVLMTSADVTLVTWDNITGINGTGIATNASAVQYDPSGTGAVSTTVQAELRQTVSVKNFGAAGNNATDDTAAFVLADGSGATSIYVPDGTYIVSSFNLTGKKLYGPGTLKWKASTSTPMITLSGDGCELNGLTFDGNSWFQASSTELINFSAAPNATIQNNTFKNGRYKCILSDVAASPGLAVVNNKFADWGVISSCDVVTFRSPNYIGSGNYFENIGDGHCFRTGLFNTDATTTPVTNGTIVGNVFYNTLHVGVTCELYTQGLSITGNTFDTLNAGVKIESSGGTQFDITIDGNVFKNLDGSGVGTSLNLTGNNVIFSNNIVRDCVGVCDVGNNSVVSGNTFDNCGDVASATSAIRATTSAFSKAVVTGNIVINSPYRAIEGGADSIITNNVIKNTGDRAINLGGADRARVIGNIIDGCTYGIIANSTSNDILVSANDVRNASVSAYSIADAASAYLDQNNFGLSLAIPTLTIATGAVTAPRRTGAVIKIDTEAAAASDDLDTINVLDGGQIGHTIVLQPTTATRVVTVKDNTGNLRLAGDFVMNSAVDTITLIWSGSNWDEISRSDNA